MVEKRAKFTQMKDGDAEDYSIIAASNAKDYNHLADKVLTHLKMLQNDYGGFQVDRLTHSLQTATRAYRDGKDDEYVVCALIHDIGDNLAPANHAEFAATILQPFVSEENYWIVKHHGIFQGYYFFEFLGLDKNMRDNFIDNPYYESCREFCEKYDQNSFDPDYDTLGLDFFIPMVRELFKKPKRSIYLQS
tara:strand:+ start:294 stop:866 length:573 start_codon:yes stop_codon:yes gene_type:complete